MPSLSIKRLYFSLYINEFPGLEPFVPLSPCLEVGEAGRERKDTGKQTQKGSLEYRYLSWFQIGLQIKKKKIFVGCSQNFCETIIQVYLADTFLLKVKTFVAGLIFTFLLWQLEECLPVPSALVILCGLYLSTSLISLGSMVYVGIIVTNRELPLVCGKQINSIFNNLDSLFVGLCVSLLAKNSLICNPF